MLANAAYLWPRRIGNAYGFADFKPRLLDLSNNKLNMSLNVDAMLMEYGIVQDGWRYMANVIIGDLICSSKMLILYDLDEFSK